MNTLLNAILAFMFIFGLLFIGEIILILFMDRNQLGDIQER